MATYDAASYGPVIAHLLREPRLQPLGPGAPNQAARPGLDRLTMDTAFAHAAVRDRDMANCCLAGLWLYHDFLDESHRLSQEIATTSGSYWHGIMHRREPDYGNAKYWCRHVGTHPVFESLQAAAVGLPGAGSSFLAAQTAWNPFTFVDFCEASAAGRGNETLARQVQQREWELLFDHCYRKALGVAG